MKDELGERMKGQYEDRTRYFVPRRTFTIIRLDGKAFHTYTRGLEKPFDHGLSEDMDAAIIAMLPEIQGAVFAYTQSDEISVLVTDFALPTTSAWFDGNIQKMASVSASIITAEFNKVRARRWRKSQQALNDSSLLAQYGMDEEATDNTDFDKELATNPFTLAYFDSRVFTIPDRTEVMNYFIWRNQDASRNSVSMVAQSVFPHKQLQGVSTTGMKEMLEKTATPWESFSQSDRYGRVIVKENYTMQNRIDGTDMLRTRWVSKPAWPFVTVREDLMKLIPNYE